MKRKIFAEDFKLQNYGVWMGMEKAVMQKN